MSICISKIVAKSQQMDIKLKQWLWFVGLWFMGLGVVILMTLPIKLLIKICLSTTPFN